MGLAITGIVGVAGIVAAGVKESQYPGEILTYVPPCFSHVTII
jgi:hypothetical protein